MWRKLFKIKPKKEESLMTTTTTNNKAIDNLKGTINKQNNQISGLLANMSSLRDEIHLLKKELSRFKNDVATDVKYLTERVDSE
jgi:predicted RNase H-like nuclease (RuvC/YqgF family)